ncbi:hypothetical protein AGMMS49975_27430 [Clostridia bacterium]|nr:hypothetical protein AGMMS49975_27430 [Clostridia bacterium]
MNELMAEDFGMADKARFDVSENSDGDYGDYREYQPRNLYEKYKDRLWWLFVGGCWGLTPYIFRIAQLERGHGVLEIEVLFPILPLFVWLAVKALKSDMADYSDEDYEDCDDLDEYSENDNEY